MTYVKPDIRKQTYLIILKDGKYLSKVGTLLIGGPSWNQHLSNAWRTRNRELARRVAEKYNGQLALFNTIIWEVRPL